MTIEGNMRTIQLLTDRNWMQQELASGGADVRHSYGLDVPAHNASDSWWVPQGVAARIVRALKSEGKTVPNFTAPGPLWETTVPQSLLRRRVESFTVEQILGILSVLPEEMAEEYLYAGWWKAAEAKIDTFPAKSYSNMSQLTEKLRELPFDTMLQHSGTTLFVDTEYRIFMLDGKAVTGSAYYKTVPGSSTGYTYYDGLGTDPEKLEEVSRFAEEVVKATPSPKAFTLDVAVLFRGSLAVMEANPAWCSAWYGASMTEVVDTIEASFTDPDWAWTPDAYHAERAEKQPLLKVM